MAYNVLCFGLLVRHANSLIYFDIIKWINENFSFMQSNINIPLSPTTYLNKGILTFH